MKRGGRLKPVSDKRRREDGLRRVVVEMVRRRDRGCVASDLVPEVACAGPLDVDEIVPRSKWRAGYLDPDNCQVLCRAHHDWKHHERPDLARDLGLMR